MPISIFGSELSYFENVATDGLNSPYMYSLSGIGKNIPFVLLRDGALGWKLLSGAHDNYCKTT